MTAGRCRRRHGARERAQLGAVDPCHASAGRRRRAGGTAVGRRPRERRSATSARRDGGWQRGLCRGRRASGRPGPVRGRPSKRLASACVDGRLGRSAGPRGDGVDLREGGVDRGRQVGHAGGELAARATPGPTNAPQTAVARPSCELKMACLCAFAAKSSRRPSSPGPRPDRRDIGRADPQQHHEHDRQERQEDGGETTWSVGPQRRPREAADEVRRAGAGTWLRRQPIRVGTGVTDGRLWRRSERSPARAASAACRGATSEGPRTAWLVASPTRGGGASPRPGGRRVASRARRGGDSGPHELRSRFATRGGSVVAGVVAGGRRERLRRWRPTAARFVGGRAVRGAARAAAGAPGPLPCCVVDVFVATAPAIAVLLCEITSSPGLLIRMMTTMF